MSTNDRVHLVLNVVATIGSLYMAYRTLGFMGKLLKPSISKDGEDRAIALMKTLKISGKLELTTHESIVAMDLILSAPNSVEFADIGGMEDIKAAVHEMLILPMQRPELYGSRSRLLSMPKGILLYGPPGTGKTMLARAIACESGVTFLNLRMATLVDKFFGESQKLISAVFSLARKLAPTVIFIDEIDSFLRTRSLNDHEVMAQMKADFMMQWDGLTTVEDKIAIIGATNRPGDLDKAVMRRMARKFLVNLPDAKQRVEILRVILKGEAVDSNLCYEDLSLELEGYSGSDMKELCKTAALEPVRSFLKDEAMFASGQLTEKPDAPRSLGMRDFLEAKRHVVPTSQPMAQAFF